VEIFGAQISYRKGVGRIQEFLGETRSAMILSQLAKRLEKEKDTVDTPKEIKKSFFFFTPELNSWFKSEDQSGETWDTCRDLDGAYVEKRKFEPRDE
jgi:hypothetical protein